MLSVPDCTDFDIVNFLDRVDSEFDQVTVYRNPTPNTLRLACYLFSSDSLESAMGHISDAYHNWLWDMAYSPAYVFTKHPRQEFGVLSVVLKFFRPSIMPDVVIRILDTPDVDYYRAANQDLPPYDWCYLASVRRVMAESLVHGGVQRAYFL